MIDINYIDGVIQGLQQAERTVRGDGFGYAGDLKAEYRMAVRRLESLKVKLSEAPSLEVRVEVGNPDCFGIGKDNTSECQCRVVFNKFAPFA